MQGGTLVYGFQGNFLLRARPYLVDEEFATVTTNTTQSPERIQALLEDLNSRFAGTRIYLLGTSSGTEATMALAPYLSQRIAGVIHTASLGDSYRFDARKYRNRQLLVHHKDDGCRFTPYFAAKASHDRFGTDLITMQGGTSIGDPCEAFSHHGFHGIERETAAAIKKWIKDG